MPSDNRDIVNGVPTDKDLSVFWPRGNYDEYQEVDEELELDRMEKSYERYIDRA